MILIPLVGNNTRILNFHFFSKFLSCPTKLPTVEHAETGRMGSELGSGVVLRIRTPSAPVGSQLDPHFHERFCFPRRPPGGTKTDVVYRETHNKGGLERTEEEFRHLFETAGFTLTRVVPTSSDVTVIEGKPQEQSDASPGKDRPRRERKWMNGARLEEKIEQSANFFLDLVLRLRRMRGCDSIECPVRRFWGCPCAATVQDSRFHAGV